MKFLYISIFMITLFSFGFLGFFLFGKTNNANKLTQLFPNSVDDLKNMVNTAINQAKNSLEEICNIKLQDNSKQNSKQNNSKSLNFENTCQALDEAISNFSTVLSTAYTLTFVSPNEELRNYAQEAVAIMQNFYIDNFSQNKKLYEILKDYSKQLEKTQEKLSKSQKYFLTELLTGYEKSGLKKEDAVLDQIKKIQKELTLLSLDFEKNISSDNRFIEVPKDQLKGLDDNFINSLKEKNGLYTLGTDYPTYFKVLQDCEVENTRKALWKEFNLRGYPKNDQVLKKIISLRDNLAKLLDYSSYSHLDIDDQMAKDPKTVEQFLSTLIDRCKVKAKSEIELLKKDLPESVEAVDGKIKPWDLSFLQNYYSKKYLSIDESEITKYFTIDKTLAALFGIYENFFGINFKESDAKNLWHEDVKAFDIYKDEDFIGTLLLDLFPRENKYNHACEITIVPSTKSADNKIEPAVVLVIANFKQDKSGKPSLLTLKEVKTFFHECGHAIHSLLGTTSLKTQSGTSVKTDFVEMPSQMLEEWMWDADILKMISSHCDTEQCLPDNIIENLQKSKNIFAGSDTLRQIFFATFSLNLFKENTEDIAAKWKSIYKELIKDVVFDDDSFAYCSFGHLTNYGSKYYGYLWSKVFALDLFDKIKEHGLFNKEVADSYVKNIISKGGSKDPSELLRNFLSREPNADAFFKDLGL